MKWLRLLNEANSLLFSCPLHQPPLNEIASSRLVDLRLREHPSGYLSAVN